MINFIPNVFSRTPVIIYRDRLKRHRKNAKDKVLGTKWTKTMTMPHLRPLKLLGLKNAVRMPGVDKINRTGSAFRKVHYSYRYNILRRRVRPAWSTVWKIAFPSKPSFTASRYISQDGDYAISEHSLVNRSARSERYWCAVKRDVNCHQRRKTPEGGELLKDRDHHAGVVLSKKQKSKWERVNKYSRNRFRCEW